MSRAVVGRSRFAATVLGLMILTALSSNKDLVGHKLYTLGLWYGAVGGLAAAAYCGGMWGLFGSKRRVKLSQDVSVVVRRAA